VIKGKLRENAYTCKTLCIYVS